MPSHDDLVLLRSSFSAPRLRHTLRCAPCDGHPELQYFDDLFREGISSITNSSLRDTQWIQSSLPIHNGSLGIRRVTLLSLSASLVSAASTLDLKNALLTICGCAPDRHVASSRLVWTSINGVLCPQEANGQAAEAAADRKKAKYRAISTSNLFIPVAVETMGPINQEVSAFLEDLGNPITEISEDL